MADATVGKVLNVYDLLVALDKYKTTAVLEAAVNSGNGVVIRRRAIPVTDPATSVSQLVDPALVFAAGAPTVSVWEDDEDGRFYMDADMDVGIDFYGQYTSR